MPYSNFPQSHTRAPNSSLLRKYRQCMRYLHLPKLFQLPSSLPFQRHRKNDSSNSDSHVNFGRAPYKETYRQQAFYRAANGMTTARAGDVFLRQSSPHSDFVIIGMGTTVAPRSTVHITAYGLMHADVERWWPSLA